MTKQWTKQDMPDFTGKVVVITGANSGLGYDSTVAFAQKGATVVMACRSLERGEKARQEVAAAVPNAKLDLMALDNGDLASVRAFAEAFKVKYDRLDILLNNAGIMAVPRELTKDGFETQLGVNHLAHFALTGLLLDVITRTPHARIHNVSSSAHYTGALNFDDLMGEREYSRWGAYGQSKLANVVFTLELHKRLQTAGFDTITNTSHPGLVNTNLQATSMDKSRNPLEGVAYAVMMPLLSQDVSMGVLPQLYGCAATEARGGVFYGPSTFNVKGYPKEQKPSARATDPATQARLWQVSEQLTGVTYAMLEKVTA